jgi:hypothetical protein
MIGLKYSCENWENAKNTHVDFMVDRVSKRIEYYQLLIICIRVGRYKKLSALQFENYIIKKLSLTSSGKHSTFRSRANKLFSKKVILKKLNYHLLMNSSDLRPELFDLRNIYDGLVILKKELKGLLEIEFKTPYFSSLLRVRLLRVETYQIKYLYDILLNYDDFSKLSLVEKWGPYQLLEQLNISVCPYCNRQYTITIQKGGKKLIRPDLDHFLPKGKNKLLQISFFNLIPSCQVCNQGLKNSKRIYYSKHLNPYEDNSKHQLMSFNYVPEIITDIQGITDDFKIIIKPNSFSPRMQKKVEGNIELFQLEEIYNTHKEIVKELIRKKDIWGTRHIGIIKNCFSNLRITKEESYRLLYGNYFEEKNFTRRPLAKLTKDIAEKLKLDTLI